MNVKVVPSQLYCLFILSKITVLSSREEIGEILIKINFGQIPCVRDANSDVKILRCQIEHVGIVKGIILFLE